MGKRLLLGKAVLSGFAQKVAKLTRLAGLFVQLAFLHKKSLSKARVLIGLAAWVEGANQTDQEG